MRLTLELTCENLHQGDGRHPAMQAMQAMQPKPAKQDTKAMSAMQPLPPLAWPRYTAPATAGGAFQVGFEDCGSPAHTLMHMRCIPHALMHMASSEEVMALSSQHQAKSKSEKRLGTAKFVSKTAVRPILRTAVKTSVDKEGLEGVHGGGTTGGTTQDMTQGITLPTHSRPKTKDSKAQGGSGSAWTAHNAGTAHLKGGNLKRGFFLPPSKDEPNMKKVDIYVVSALKNYIGYSPKLSLLIVI